MKYSIFFCMALLLIIALCPLSVAAEQSCEHVYGEWVLTKAPTCVEKGEVTRTCTLCGEVEAASVAEGAHIESDWKLDKAPEVDVPGSMQKTCTVCKTVLQTQELAALPAPESDSEEPTTESTVSEPEEQPWIEITLPVAIGICLLPNAVLVIVLLIRKIRRKIASKYFD